MWPFDTLDLILSQNWLHGAMVSVLNAAITTTGLILMKKAQYRLMGSKIRSSDPNPPWKRLARAPMWQVGFVLSLLQHPLYLLARKYTGEATATPVNLTTVLIINLFLSFSLLYERFDFKDVFATIMCIVGSCVMNNTIHEELPVHFDEMPADEVIARVNQIFENETFPVYAAILVVACAILMYAAAEIRIHNYVQAVVFPLLVGLLNAVFRLTSKLSCTLLWIRGDHKAAVWRDGHLATITALNGLVFLALVLCTCEALRQLSCRFFIPAFLVVSEVLLEAQDLAFFRGWDKLHDRSASAFLGGAAWSLACVYFISSRHRVLSSPGQSDLNSPRNTPLLSGGFEGDPVELHRYVTDIIDEYKVRIPEAVNPAPLKVVDLRERYSGRYQVLPLFVFVGLIAFTSSLWYLGHTFLSFLCCSIFSVLQGWKMGAFVPLFGYVGVKKMAHYEGADFRALYAAERKRDKTAQPGRAKWSDICHFVIIPNYKEDLKDLRMALDSVASSGVAKEQICIIMAMEMGEKECRQKAQTLIGEYQNKFKCITATYHPTNCPGEVRGKSANTRWAANRLFEVLGCAEEKFDGTRAGGFFDLAPKDQAVFKETQSSTMAEVRQQVQELSSSLSRLSWNVEMKNTVITVGDADSEFHSEYFAALTYHYLHAGGLENDTPNRYLTIWQPPILHLKNYINQPPLVRAASLITSAHELANLADPNATRAPYSTYSLSAILASSMDSWDPDWITEDWHTAVKTFLSTGGRLKVTPIFFPILNSTPEADTQWHTLIARWEQAKRHALGISELVFMTEHLSRAARSHTGLSKLTYMWRSFFLWFKLMWIHAFVAIFPAFAPLNGWLILYFNEHQAENLKSINSWTFLLNCIFQVIGLVSVLFLFLVGVVLYEAMKHRIEGATEPSLSIYWRNPFLHLVTFTAQSLSVVPFICVGFAACEWRAAIKTALTKGGAFVYVTAAEGARQAQAKAGP
eukprot:TRINITY_DN81657_c0_g1_i1.p1 TRINITY_DN81657_c0_g1~~TRINITY_DN81657_c0_g1_i1.p1  ORF type:complete len:973 (-),score=209.90 TRINITY_DN81657_c0_g1_i1:277-3195(-)